MFGRIAIAGRCTPGRNAVLERWGKITQMEKKIIDLVPEIEVRAADTSDRSPSWRLHSLSRRWGTPSQSCDWVALVLTSPWRIASAQWRWRQ